MDRLNYHHLRYFREVAREGNLTRAAARLNLSQSALSSQIRQLEDRLGHALFDRVGRRLELTEAGGIALDHANRIFDVGEELVATLSGAQAAHPPLRVGALSTLSRNFQLWFLRPALAAQADLILSSGSSATLLRALDSYALDVVLSTEPPPRDSFPDLIGHRLAEQPVGLFGRPDLLRPGDLADLLRDTPVILPGESPIRTGFDSLCARLGVTPRIAAHVDDMAMVRLLAREGAGLAVAPAVVVADELAAGRLMAAGHALDIAETFYAITAPRAFAHPLLPALLAQEFAA